MQGAGVCDGDELVVDRSLEPTDGSVVVAVLDGELTVKRLRIGRGGVRLAAENPDIVVPELSELTVWGTVTGACTMSERGLDLTRGDRFALVDCNSFYVSCERAFDPKLEGRPVMVLGVRLNSVYSFLCG